MIALIALDKNFDMVFMVRYKFLSTKVLQKFTHHERDY